MDWLRDKKNLPIIAAITGIVVAVAVLFFFMQSRKSGGESPDQTAQAQDPYSAGAPPYSSATPPPAPTSMPGQPVLGTPQPGLSAGAGRTIAVALTPPAQPSTGDPFLPLDSGKKKVKIVPRLYVPPPGRLFMPRAEREKLQQVAQVVQVQGPQPQRRMAGLLYNQRLYAILETDGNSQVVKPGDVVENGKARVELIEPTRIVLRMIDAKNPRTIEVKMASSNRPADTTTPTGTQTPAYNPYGQYNPYGPPGSYGPRARGGRGDGPSGQDM